MSDSTPTLKLVSGGEMSRLCNINYPRFLDCIRKGRIAADARGPGDCLLFDEARVDDLRAVFSTPARKADDAAPAPSCAFARAVEVLQKMPPELHEQIRRDLRRGKSSLISLADAIKTMALNEKGAR